MLFRAFLDNNDPAPVVATVKKTLKVYPYKAGGFGSSVASYLAGDAPLGSSPAPTSPRFVEGLRMVINTIPPNDFSHYEMLDALVQQERAEAMDPEIAGQMAAIGIVKGQKFAPDARMRKILEKAAVVANAASRIHTYCGTSHHPTLFRLGNRVSTCRGVPTAGNSPSLKLATVASPASG